MTVHRDSSTACL